MHGNLKKYENGDMSFDEYMDTVRNLVAKRKAEQMRAENQKRSGAYKKESAKKAERILSQANLPQHEQYQYAEVDEDRLRYSIDPNWYGELPRTYFYDATHQITPLSGKISKAFLDKWFKNNSIN